MTSAADRPAPAPAATAAPLALVADDDPGSCRFLHDGLASLGVRARICMDGSAALRLARDEAFDLLLLDCRMPGAGARQILAALRGDPRARSTDGVAVATTAELAPADRQELLDAGFSEVLVKPCTLADLQRVLALALPERAGTVLDDRSALTASGDAATMRALRFLLREELVLLLRELDELGRDRDGFGERLHRLRSSCGFCGATALSTQTVLLQRQVQQHGATPVALARFRKALRATLQALDA